MAYIGIITSVPHACCQFPNSKVCCDSKALAFERHFNVNLQYYNSLIKIYDLINTYPLVDQEDPSQRDSDFRKALRFRVEECYANHGDRIMHFDIHSFNPNKNPDWSDSAVVIVESQLLNNDLASVGLTFFLNEGRVETKLVQMSPEYVDIQQEMNEMGVQSIILEINETLTPGQMDYIAMELVEWITNDIECLGAFYREGIKAKIPKALGAGLIGAGIGAIGGGIAGAIAAKKKGEGLKGALKGAVAGAAVGAVAGAAGEFAFEKHKKGEVKIGKEIKKIEPHKKTT